LTRTFIKILPFYKKINRQRAKLLCPFRVDFVLGRYLAPIFFNKKDKKSNSLT
jgi:hypothetical protein